MTDQSKFPDFKLTQIPPDSVIDTMLLDFPSDKSFDSAGQFGKLATVKLRKLIFTTVALPFYAFILCVIISLSKDFEEVNRTHCKVYNFLPSISSAIGNNSPQTYIWRLGVAFHLSPRIVFAFSYYGWYKKLDNNSWKYDSLYRQLCKWSLMFHLAEILCLAGLTFVSSSENFSIHEKSFIGFAICSWLYMLTTCTLFRTQKTQCLPSIRLKSQILTAFCVSIIGISYFYWRHNAYCEPYVYSFFALFEYSAVLCNMAFHTTAVMDFEQYEVSVASIEHSSPAEYLA